MSHSISPITVQVDLNQSLETFTTTKSSSNHYGRLVSSPLASAKELLRKVRGSDSCNNLKQIPWLKVAAITSIAMAAALTAYASRSTGEDPINASAQDPQPFTTISQEPVDPCPAVDFASSYGEFKMSMADGISLEKSFFLYAASGPLVEKINACVDYCLTDNWMPTSCINIKNSFAKLREDFNRLNLMEEVKNHHSDNSHTAVKAYTLLTQLSGQL